MRSTLLLAASLSLLATGCVSGGGASTAPPCERTMPEGFPAAAEGTGIGDTAPDVSMLDMNGNPVCTRDYAGQVVMINLAAGWCPPCQDETPGIQDVYEEFEAQGFIVLMAMSDDYTANGTISDDTFFQDWQEEYGITFPLIVDEGYEIYETYAPGEQAIPVSVFLDKDQIIRYRTIGLLTESQLRSRVQNMLEDPAQLEY